MKLFTVPLSLIYGMVSSIRNMLFDMNILKSVEYDIPVICVGNLSAGGTGKTPHTEMLIAYLSEKYNIAVLSRGYKRKSKGYQIVDLKSRTKVVGDEPKQIKLKYPKVNVVVCEDRREGIAQLRKDFPETNLIILDDGFQHRYVETWLNILLTEHANPFYNDHYLPWGRLRESKEGMSRAQVIIVTKTAKDIKPIEMRLISKYLSMYPYQSLFFTEMEQKSPVPLYPTLAVAAPQKKNKVIVMSAIAHNDTFINSIKESYEVVSTLTFPDHHSYKLSDLNPLVEMLEQNSDAKVLITEKDAVKLINSKKMPQIIKERIFMVPVVVKFVKTDSNRNNTKEDFLNAIMPYVEKNHKYSHTNF